MARQPWYLGRGVPTLRMVGAFRLEDPAGEVGIETHLLFDGEQLYQLPMTFRPAPIPGSDGAAGLIATAEHSVLGTRFIYDATVDPVWVQQLIELVVAGHPAEPSTKANAGTFRARGLPGDPDRAANPDPGAAANPSIELVRTIRPGVPATAPDQLGLVIGGWSDPAPPIPEGDCCLAILRERR